MAKPSKKTKPQVSAPAKTEPPTGARPPLYYAGVLAALAALLYLPTLGHGFVLDDPLVTTLNAYVQQGLGGLWDIFTHSYRAGSSVSTDSEYMYRPLSVALFAIEWGIAPQTPGIHHFFNVLYYGASVGLLFLLLDRLLGGSYRLMAFAAVALFAVHPIHTEVVANIKSRDEILCFGGMLLSLYWLWEAAQGHSRRLWYALGAFFLALLAKEGAVSLLVIAPMMLYFFGKKDDWKTALWLVLPFLGWFMLRWAVMGKASYTPDFNDNQLVDADLMERWASGFLVLGKYFSLLVWPFPLSWDYSYNQIPTANWTHPGAIAGLVMSVAVLGLGIWGWRQKRLQAFCALAYMASMGLYSNLLLLIGTLMGERLAYQASAWFCLAVAGALWQVFKVQAHPERWWTGQRTGLFAGITALVCLVFMGMSFVRAKAWKSNYTLVTTDVQHAPNSFRIQQAVGEETLLKYVDKATPPSDTARLLEQARAAFQKSTEIRPTFNNQLGLGNVAYFKKDYAAATRYFESSYQLQSNNLAKERLAITYREWGRYEGQVRQNLPQSAQYLERAFSYDSTDTQTLRDLGTVYGLMQRPDKAVVYLEKAVKAVPNDATLRGNLALAWQQLGQPEKAAAVMKGQ